MGTTDVVAGSARLTMSATDAPDVSSTAERTIIDLRGASPFVSLGHYRYLAAHQALPVQIHSRLLVIAFAVRSDFDFWVNGEVVGIGSGDAILIPPGNAYRTGVDAQTRGELMWLVAQCATASSRRSPEWQATFGVIEDLRRIGVTKFHTPRLTVDLLARILGETGDGWDGVREWREALCAAAVAELGRGLRGTAVASSPVHPGIRTAVRWATENIERPVTASDLVAVSGMSSTRFYELFFDAFGTSPKDYILRMKIERATEMLRTTTISITDLCHLLGFSSSQHFGTAFRRYVGTSPSAYRTQVLGEIR